MELLAIALAVVFAAIFAVLMLAAYAAAFVFGNLLGAGAIPFHSEPVLVRLRYAFALLLGLPMTLIGYVVGHGGKRVGLTPRLNRWFRVPARRSA